MTAAELARDVTVLDEAIAAARQGLAEGAHVDLAGLEEAVSQLCERARAVSNESRIEAVAGLATIVKALDRLAADLAAAEARARDAAEEAARRRAVDAYGRPQGS